MPPVLGADMVVVVSNVHVNPAAAAAFEAEVAAALAEVDALLAEVAAALADVEALDADVEAFDADVDAFEADVLAADAEVEAAEALLAAFVALVAAASADASAASTAASRALDSNDVAGPDTKSVPLKYNTSFVDGLAMLAISAKNACNRPSGNVPEVRSVADPDVATGDNAADT